MTKQNDLPLCPAIDPGLIMTGPFTSEIRLLLQELMHRWTQSLSRIRGHVINDHVINDDVMHDHMINEHVVISDDHVICDQRSCTNCQRWPMRL